MSLRRTPVSSWVTRANPVPTVIGSVAENLRHTSGNPYIESRGWHGYDGSFEGFLVKVAALPQFGGSGELVIGEERFSAAPGDVFFVEAGINHRFEIFTDDFATWAIFLPSE